MLFQHAIARPLYRREHDYSKPQHKHDHLKTFDVVCLHVLCTASTFTCQTWARSVGWELSPSTDAAPHRLLKSDSIRRM